MQIIFKKHMNEFKVGEKWENTIFSDQITIVFGEFKFM